MAVRLVASFVWYSAVLAATGQDKCVVTALGSNLCGDDARAWCDSTDAIRAESQDTQSQTVCDELRGQVAPVSGPVADDTSGSEPAVDDSVVNPADSDGDGSDDQADDYPDDPTRWDTATEFREGNTP